ncbi:MAG: hypothetical protein AB7H90_08490 [Alphaproteobacteria bacterium]
MAPLKELVQAIFEKTRAGKLLWSELASNAFLTNIGDNSAVISREGNNFDLVFRNSEGHVLEEIYAGRSEYNEANLDELYEAARRQALRVNETLIEMKRNLDKL